MYSELILIHRQSSTAFVADSGWLLWQTCLRKIAFGGAESMGSIQIEAGDQILSGADAYQFCLEVICGLHSPLVGETEVFGQFKNAFESWVLPETPIANVLRRFVRSLVEDAKRIRSNFLADLGSQSYGSLLRRELRDIREMTIVGGGHLTGEILPWLCKDHNDVNVLVRDLQKCPTLQKKFPQAKFAKLGEQSSALQGALILSAPVSAEWVKSWLASESSLKLVVDLRGESVNDPLETSEVKVIGLSEVMNRISQNQEIIARRRDDALKAVSEAAHTRLRAVENRPFGWDDVCA
jgi:glutamyl-tRNA reductase